MRSIRKRASGGWPLGASCPPAVAGLVRAVNVNAIQRHSGRHLAHVVQEDLEHAPSLIDANSSAAVILEALVVWIETPLEHRTPANVSARVGHAVATVQLPAISSCPLDGKAPTRPCIARLERTGVDQGTLAASTLAPPPGLRPDASARAAPLLDIETFNLAGQQRKPASAGPPCPPGGRGRETGCAPHNSSRRPAGSRDRRYRAKCHLRRC